MGEVAVVNLVACSFSYDHTPAGEKWNSMSAEKQKKYRDQYTEKRDNYKKAMEAFLEEHPEAKGAMKLR